MEDCCAPGGSSGGNDALVHLEEGRAEGMALGDAPMAACCERELEDRKEANRVRTILQRFDPSTKSERERQRVVGTAGPPDAMGMGALSLGDGEGDGLGDGDDDDLDDDDFLERYRAQRLRELQERGGGRDEGGAAKGLRLEVGKGVVPSVDNVALQGLLKTHAESRWNGGGARAPTLLVCQFSVKGDAFSHELSEVVDEIAATDFFGTNFVRVEKVKGVVVNQRDKVNQAALCCFADGQHRAILFGEEIGAPSSVDEREIKRWLLSLGCRRNGGKVGSDDDEGDEEPCEVCGRCYPHEHVTAVYGLRSDSDEDTEGEQDAWE